LKRADIPTAITMIIEDAHKWVSFPTIPVKGRVGRSDKQVSQKLHTRPTILLKTRKRL
jgi:transcription-repair coupling factor (superfamily II helicase)